MNGKGPKIDPWGTPVSTGLKDEFLFLILQYCFLFVRYDLKNKSSLQLFHTFQVYLAI